MEDDRGFFTLTWRDVTATLPPGASRTSQLTLASKKHASLKLLYFLEC
jgi:hypothetical protein